MNASCIMCGRAACCADRAVRSRPAGPIVDEVELASLDELQDMHSAVLTVERPASRSMGGLTHSTHPVQPRQHVLPFPALQCGPSGLQDARLPHSISRCHTSSSPDDGLKQRLESEVCSRCACR